MLFLTRKLMKSPHFHSPTILTITDRTDLDDQLSKQFIASKKYIGDETVVSIEFRDKLREELQGRESGGVYLTTIQKFTEDIQLLTDRANVICISDEAHRSQINLAQLLEELKREKNSFKAMGIDYEEKAFYDIMKAVAKKYEFEYPVDKMIELSKRIKIIVDEKARYTDWSTREDIKANLQVDLILCIR